MSTPYTPPYGGTPAKKTIDTLSDNTTSAWPEIKFLTWWHAMEHLGPRRKNPPTGLFLAYTILVLVVSFSFSRAALSTFAPLPTLMEFKLLSARVQDT